MARILVIDDDSSLLQMMSLMLTRAGHQTILAEDGKRGIEAARQELPDMAIIDVMMPDLSGYEVCRILREDPQTQNIPLLILTALSQSEHREQAETAGADDYVSKPVTRDDLVSHVSALLESGARNQPVPRQEDPFSDELVDPGPPPAPTNIIKEAFQELYQAPPPAPPPAYQQPAQPAQPAPVQSGATGLPLVAVMGLNSGVGTTTLAINLALGLMQFGRSCVVDLSTQGGQVAPQLQIMSPPATWHNLMDITYGSDKRRVGGALVLNHPSGVGILAAPINPVSEQLHSAALTYIYQVLAEGFRRIVVDVPANFSPMSVATLRQASHVVLVAGDDPAKLASAPGVLAKAQQLSLPGQVHVVINRTRPHGITNMDVMQALNQPVAADIPYEGQQVNAIMQGAPLLMSYPGSLFAKTVLYLARTL